MLSDCDITDAGLKTLRECVGLRILDITGCEITETGAAAFRDALPECEVTADGLLWDVLTEQAASQAFSSLRSLDLSGREEVRDDRMFLLTRFTNLESLNLSGCLNLTDDGLAHLTCLTALRHLSLRECDLTGRGLGYLKQVGVESLDLGACECVSDAGLEELKLLTTLQSLDLSVCSRDH